MNKRLESQLRFETLISDLSAEFVRLSGDEVDAGIEHALGQILTFFQCERCGLLELTKDRKTLRLSHACYAEGIEHVPRDINLAPFFPYGYQHVVERGQPFIAARLEDLPPEAEKDRASWAAMGVCSSLDIPLFLGQAVRYIISIQCMSKERDWPEEYIPRLRLLGEVFVNALERRKADEALRELSGQLIHAAEHERARIARDLHDDFNQRLALLAVEVDLVSQGLREPSEATRRQLAAIASGVRALSNDIQHLSHQLHPAKLEQLGLVTAVQSLCREVSAASNVLIEFSPGDTPRRLPDELGLCLYRIAQEALQNVVKHSGADHASVHISVEPGRLSLTVTDSGRGFCPTSEKAAGGLGIVSMQERTRLLGGEFLVESAPSQGTRVTVRVPFSPEDER